MMSTPEEIKGAARALLAALEARSDEMARHSRRVGRVTVAVGRALGLSRGCLLTLGFAALLHDVGKITTRDAVLHKAGEFTAAEREHMRHHVRAGAKILRSLSMPEEIVRLVELHHERPDGLGYPHGVKAADIPFGARLIGVVDAADSMMHSRCYRAGRGYQAAAAELVREQGKQFCPEAVQAFFLISPEQIAAAGEAVEARKVAA